MPEPTDTPEPHDSPDLTEDEEAAVRPRGDRPRWAACVVLLGALAGVWFSGVSTGDFVAHLDRQVHSVRCSLLPGDSPQVGESGCRTVMLSPYSSFFREHLWGGLPVALWALAVFCFLGYRAAHLVLRGRPERHETRFLLAATLLPCGMSLPYAWLASNEVGALCKVCLGIWLASGVCFVGALAAHLTAPHEYRPRGLPPFAVGFSEGVAFVAVLTVLYLGLAPAADAARARQGCGTLVKRDDPARAMLHLGSAPGGVPAIDLLDPLCPACRAFEARLATTRFAARLDRRYVLFPLDSTCNWMVGTSLHPGACQVSEALLCAGGVAGRKGDPAEARRLLDWAFTHQEALMAQARDDPRALRRRLETEFPVVRGCLGSARARSKLTKGLRWTVANALPVLAPQLFIDGRRLCSEDTDLGLEYALGRMIPDGGREGRP